MSLPRLVKLNGTPVLLPVAAQGLVSLATRSGIHKNGAEVADTTGSTGGHRVEVVVDSADQVRIRYGFWSWMAVPLPSGTLKIDTEVQLDDGTLVAATFSGVSTLTVAADGTAMPYYDSDVLPGVTLTRGDLIVVRTFIRSASGSAPFGTSWYSDSGTTSWFLSGNHLLDVSDPAPGAAYNNDYYGHPISVLGMQSTNLPSWVCYGDSNMANSDQFSWYERALAKRYPYYRMNSAGSGLGNLATYPNVQGQIEGHRYAIIAMGTNNWGSPYSTNGPLLLSDIAALRAGGVQKILICTLPPSTTSTDSWATVANQTPLGGDAAQVTSRLDMNAAIRAMASSHGGVNADAVFDAASYVEVNSSNLFTIDGGRWAVKTAPGSASAATYGTGPHYEERGMAAAAVGGALAIDRLVNGETGFLQQNPNLGT